MIDFRVRSEGVFQFAVEVCCALGGKFRQVDNGGLGWFMQRVERLVVIGKGRVSKVLILWRAAGELRRGWVHHRVHAFVQPAALGLFKLIPLGLNKAVPVMDTAFAKRHGMNHAITVEGVIRRLIKDVCGIGPNPQEMPG